ncbi:MAG: hypothetical protein DRP11_02905 [Candidatus Aenigmatarchaeota archaeon]|nr:MAG: hypothetical protein DRP11_02905 [Candidatus Aenigmarchaeota archaeon]
MKSVLKEVERILNREGFLSLKYPRGCFDIAARRENLLLIKTLLNIDSFQDYQANNLKVLSHYLSASPLLIGERTRREWLKEGIVYERFGIPSVNIETFDGIMKGDYPRAIRFRGGLFGRVNPEKLREARLERELSRRELAEAIGITKKSIYEHERGMFRIMFDVLESLESFLERKVSERIDPFSFEIEKPETKPSDRLEKEVAMEMERLGFRTDFVSKAPLDIVAECESVLLSDVERNAKLLERNAPFLKLLSELAEAPALLLSKKPSKREVSGLILMDVEELRSFCSGKELVKEIEG